MSEISKGALTSENNNSFPNNNTGYITPTILRTFNQNMIDSLVDEISYTADSASFNQRINVLDPSSSLQAINALNAFTQSQTAFNAAATASIVALQNFSSSLDATFATDAQLTALSTSIAVTDLAQSQSIAALQSFSSSLDATFATDAQLTALSTSLAVTDNGQDTKINSLTNATSSYITSAQTASMTVLSSSYAVTASFALNAGASVDTGSLVTTSSFNAFTQSYLNDSASVDSRLDSLETAGYVTNSITASSLVTASFSSQTLTFTKGDGSQFSLAIPDVSGSTIDTGSFATTGSNNFIGNENITGSLLVRSGSIYSISNNTTINPDLYYSASTAGQVNIIRGWGDDPAASGVLSNQANFTSSFRITGSNNIVSLPLQRATSIAGGTADMTGYISGSANTLTSNIGGIYLNSGSQLFPKTIGNTLGANSNILMTFTTSSLGNPAVNNNTINGANFVINHPSGSVNLASINFLLGGTITSSQAFVTNVRPNINQNINVGNITTLRHISSSINYTANIGNSVVTVENFMSSSGLTSGNAVNVTNNAFFGGAAGVFQSIFVSGSQSANSTRNIIDNLFGGRNNQITASLVSSSASNVVSNIVYGQTLIVNGNQGPSGGSAFFGRFNDTGSNLNSLADIVFAVGTGVTAGTRKTGLWIDSGSLTTINGGLYVTQSQVTLTNSGSTPDTLALAVRSGSVEVTSPQGNGYFYTNLPITSSNLRINGDGIISDLFVSGVFAGNSTLNVAGNSYFTGSVNVNNSANITGSLYIQNGSGDFYIYGHKMFNGGEFWSTTTQSGSAGVSGSITFNNSGSVNGVSLANNSQLTVANAGTYNIQFSAQIETSAGADTAYLWFKKNGTNISDSATKVVLANNTAQVMTVNILDEAAANDYYELGYQFTNGNATILSEAASGNIPAIPSVIATITQAR